MVLSLDRSKLEKVYWIGGSPCSGKSSISRILVERFDLDLLSVDSEFERHVLRLNPAQHPCLTRWQQMSWDERWMRPSEMLLQEVIACYEEHFSLVLEDVLKAKDSRAQLVEGSAVLPDLVAGLLPHVYQGVWIVPNPEFQTFYYSQRSWARKALADCADPETAFANWMERDSQFGFWVAERANQLGLSLLTVNGSQTIAENANWIAEHFKLARSGENRGK